MPITAECDTCVGTIKLGSSAHCGTCFDAKNRELGDVQAELASAENDISDLKERLDDAESRAVEGDHREVIEEIATGDVDTALMLWERYAGPETKELLQRAMSRRAAAHRKLAA